MHHIEVRREPEWDDEQRELMQAYLATRDDRGPHGIPMSEATRPGSRWKVDLPTRDFAQQELNRAQKKYYEQYPDADRSADIWTVEEDTTPA